MHQGLKMRIVSLEIMQMRTEELDSVKRVDAGSVFRTHGSKENC